MNPIDRIIRQAALPVVERIGTRLWEAAQFPYVATGDGPQQALDNLKERPFFCPDKWDDENDED